MVRWRKDWIGEKGMNYKIRIKKSDISQIWKISYFYIFAVLYFQIPELFLSFSITKIFLLLLIILSSMGMFVKQQKKDIFLLAVICTCLVYLIYYLKTNMVFFDKIYPFVIILIMSSMYLSNANSVKEKLNLNSINNLILGYVLINLILYILKIKTAFQDNGVQLQFKGALPHSNLFGSVVISLFILIFWDKSRKSIVNKIFLTILILASLSRTFIMLNIALWLIWIVTFFGKKINIWIKVVLESVVVFICGVPLFNSLVGNISFFSRFSTGFFSNGNGRDYLQACFYKTLSESTRLEKITGFNLANRYAKLTIMDFSHSFTENSYMAVLTLMGIIGGVILIATIVRLIKGAKNIQSIVIIIIMMISLLVQDTLLSTQAGIIFFFSLIVMRETVPQSLIKYKANGRKNGKK